MRALQTHDLFTAMKIVNAAGIKEEFQRIALKARSGEFKEEEVGADMLLSFLGACADDKAEKAIYEFLGGLLEIEPASIRVMNPLELIENVKKLGEVIDVEAWKNFFRILLTSIQK